MRTFVIAEPGCTHEGSLETMLRLIGAAHTAGCDAYKNQYLGNPDEVRRRRHSDYQSYDWLNYPIEWHAICREKCNELGMDYGCSTNLAEDLATVAPYVQFHKRPSFENNDHEWLSAAKESGQRFMVSTGMLDHAGLMQLIEDAGSWGEILHCTSSYPAPIQSLNLEVIPRYALDGLSDHSHHFLTGAMAVALGSKVIEAHLRLHDTPESNPDYWTAWVPTDYAFYVGKIREAEILLGDGRKQVQPAEAAMLRYKVGA